MNCTLLSNGKVKMVKASRTAESIFSKKTKEDAYGIGNTQDQGFVFSKGVLKALDGAQLLLFDLDGTLADTESYHWRAYNDLLSRQNISLSPDDIQRYIGYSEIVIYEMLRKEFGAVIDDETFLAARMDAFLKIAEEEKLELFDYVQPLLRAYRNVPRALVTAQRPEIVSELLTRWNLNAQFPEVYRLNCHDGTLDKRTVFKDPVALLPPGIVLDGIDKVVVIEDAPHVISMAREVGLRVIGIVNETNTGLIDASAIIDTTS